MTLDETDAEPLDALILETRAAFAEQGMTVDVREELRALTASANGGAFFTILLNGPAPFLVWFAKLFADDTYVAAKNLVKRLRRSDSGCLVVSDGNVRVLIEPDLPDNAILQLAEPLPPAPSGELHYDRATGLWVDSEE